MRLFERVCRPAKTTQQFLPLHFLFPSPVSPRKKHPRPTQRLVTKDSRPNPGSDRVLTPSRGRISRPLATVILQNKHLGANTPPPSAIRSCVHAMDQGYPLTGPSPGDNPPIYTDMPNPIVFLPVSVSTSGRVYDDFTRLFILHVYLEASIISGELPEESEQFRFLQDTRLAILKGSVGLLLAQDSAMRVTIPIDLSTRPFIPLSRCLNSRRVLPLLNQSMVLFPQRSH
jgi:hypothetical protein